MAHTTSTSFDCTGDNFASTALVSMSGDQLRKLVIAVGTAVLDGQRTEAIPTAFQASGCPADRTQLSGPTCIYAGVDSVMVPATTDAQKLKRREKIKHKRQRSGQKCPPLPPSRQGPDKQFKDFKTVTFCDKIGEHWHERLTFGPLTRAAAKRLGFSAADEKIANSDGATRIRNQLTARPHDLPLDGLGPDFYHLADNVHQSRRIVYSEDSDEGRRWEKRLLHTPKREGYDTASEQLFAWRQPL